MLIGATPLLLAARYGEVEIMKVLGSSGADAKATLPDGTTALMTVIASTRGYGAFRAGDRRERYQGPADVAAKVDGEDERVTLDAARVAVALGVDVNAANKDGDTALHLAAGLSLDTVIPLLVEHGARLDARNKRDQTPLAITTVAAIRGFYAMEPAPAEGDRGTAAEARRHGIIHYSGGSIMAKRYVFPLIVGGFVTVLAAVLTSVPTTAVQSAGEQVAVDRDDVGGVVTGPKGPEAGVWVVAETSDLPTKFVRIVVTDDRGRYLLPDLPQANYDIWVRGYGLVDSPKVKSAPGKQLNLKAVAAPTPKAAAEYYPAGYWLSLIKVPDKSEFPGTGPDGNGISPNFKAQGDWIRNVKSGGCTACHQLGNKATREIPKELGTFHSSIEAWDRRIQSGQAGTQMAGALNNWGKQRALTMFADWTDRIAQANCRRRRRDRRVSSATS